MQHANIYQLHDRGTTENEDLMQTKLYRVRILIWAVLLDRQRDAPFVNFQLQLFALLGSAFIFFFFSAGGRRSSIREQSCWTNKMLSMQRRNRRVQPTTVPCYARERVCSGRRLVARIVRHHAGRLTMQVRRRKGMWRARDNCSVEKRVPTLSLGGKPPFL